MPRNIVILWDPVLADGSSQPLTEQVWQSAAEGMTLHFASSSDLAKQLQGADLFINPYGSVFPVEAWTGILAYLESGGNFLNWGGVPFRSPVAANSPSGRRSFRPCSNYHRRIGIVQSYCHSPSNRVKVVSCHPRLDALVRATELVCPDFYPLTVRLTYCDRHEEPNVDGGIESPREAEYQPLVHCIDKNRTPVAAPVTRMDRLAGEFAGGRWIFVAANLAQLSQDQIKGWVELLPTLLEMVLEGAAFFEVVPSLACFLPDEIPSLRVRFHKPVRNVGSITKPQLRLLVRLIVRTPRGRTRQITREIVHRAALHELEVPIGLSCPPGFYAVRASLMSSEGRVVEETISGFWCRDKRLLFKGPRFSVDGDMIRRKGKVYPLIGTSYTCALSHRKFLWWSNPGIWDRDFAEMSAAGVSVVRTGIWGGHRYLMPEPGVWREDALRALDAFILTAQLYSIPLIFTFFTFTPPLFGGENPYLDPRSVDAQHKFVLTLIDRYRECPALIWDWINEPSVMNPKRLWVTRPNGDRWEAKAWREWLRKRHGDIDSLRDAWHVRPDEVPSFEKAPMPEEQDFRPERDFLAGAHPLRALDFYLFSQEVFRDWVRGLRDLCRSAGGTQITTVGQDEGGCLDRPSPMQHADQVDFTSVHTWWLNDSLLWDGIVTKVRGVPNVVEETGVMYVENPDGEAWRTEERCAWLLERKYLYSLASASAGTIQWTWHSNTLLADDNEVSIGFTRADGTKKPEFDVHRRMARFWWDNREYWTGRQEDPIVLILPNSCRFSWRREAVQATRRAVKVLTKALHMGVQAVSEGDLSRLGNPRLVILPSPGSLSDEAWNSIKEYVERGGILLASGVLERDAYFRLTSRLAEVGIPGLGPIPVSFQELLFMSGNQFLLTYSDLKQHWLEREAWTGEATIWESHVGRGYILYSPLPLEMADQFAPSVHFYRRGMELAGIESLLIIKDYIPTTFVRLIRYKEADLLVAVNEANDPVAMSFNILSLDKTWRIQLDAQRGGAYLIDRKTAEIIDQF